MRSNLPVPTKYRRCSANIAREIHHLKRFACGFGGAWWFLISPRVIHHDTSPNTDQKVWRFRQWPSHMTNRFRCQGTDRLHSKHRLHLSRARRWPKRAKTASECHHFENDFKGVNKGREIGGTGYSFWWAVVTQRVLTFLVLAQDSEWSGVNQLFVEPPD